MKYESDRFVRADKAEKEEVDGGVIRQILGFNDALMMVKAHFGTGSIGYTHAHPHAQLAYVESGVFEFTIGDETATLKKGDCAYIPSGVEHGAICKEEGALLDIFSPIREDFLKG